MADDAGDKTEAPTARKRSEAREQGNIARSADLTASVLLIGVLMLLKQFGPGLIAALKLLVEETLSIESLSNLRTDDVGHGLLRAVVIAGAAMAPFFAGVVLIAVVINLVQVGWFLNTKKLRPNLAALNPLKGIGKLFGKSQTLVQLGMTLLKLSLVAVVAYFAVRGKVEQILSLQGLGISQVFGLGAEVIYFVGIRIGLLLLVLAIIDYAYQRFRVERELKMTKQEVKDEMRRMEGDPKLKGRRRQIAAQMATQRLTNEVTTADVVVTDANEFAIALKYDITAMHAPRVIAKGHGFLASRIRDAAVTAGVPLVERKPLARALYKRCDAGHDVPEQYYAAVAEILAYVYELGGKAQRRQSA